MKLFLWTFAEHREQIDFPPFLGPIKSHFLHLGARPRPEHVQVKDFIYQRRATELRRIVGPCILFGPGREPGRAGELLQGCLVQVGNGIELEAVGLQFESYRWRPCGVTWDSCANLRPTYGHGRP